MCIPGSALRVLAKIVEIDVSEVGTQNNKICSLQPNHISTLQLCFLHLFHLFAFCWHTGDNVRLSAWVKLSEILCVALLCLSPRWRLVQLSVVVSGDDLYSCRSSSAVTACTVVGRRQRCIKHGQSCQSDWIKQYFTRLLNVLLHNVQRCTSDSVVWLHDWLGILRQNRVKCSCTAHRLGWLEWLSSQWSLNLDGC